MNDWINATDNLLKFRRKNVLQSSSKVSHQQAVEKLERCKNIEIKDVKLDDVDDIKDIKIDRRKSSEDRILDFLIKVKNPYIFKVNRKLVKIRFS